MNDTICQMPAVKYRREKFLRCTDRLPVRWLMLLSSDSLLRLKNIQRSYLSQDLGNERQQGFEQRCRDILNGR